MLYLKIMKVEGQQDTSSTCMWSDKRDLQVYLILYSWPRPIHIGARFQSDNIIFNNRQYFCEIMMYLNLIP
jgi:hypothetical protein